MALLQLAHHLLVVTVVVVASVATPGECIVDPSLPNIFYPFGDDVGDNIGQIQDDGSIGPINIPDAFPFYGSNSYRLHVDLNGAFTFDSVLGSTPPPFPTEEITAPFPTRGNKIVAPYWSDVDMTRNNGRLYYRSSTDPTLLEKASADVLASNFTQCPGTFNATWIFIATWHNVTYYSGSTTTEESSGDSMDTETLFGTEAPSTDTEINSFQGILVTNGTLSFAIFNYGNLTWTNGTAGGGYPKSEQVPAQVGFNAGDGFNYYVVPASRTDGIVDIYKQSNVGITGRWIFRIDQHYIGSTVSCDQTVGCMVDGVLREVGSNWTDPASCTNSTCVDYEGYAYVENTYCYDACVNETCVVGCLVDGILREVGSNWTDPASCTNSTCVDYEGYAYVDTRYCYGACVNETCFVGCMVDGVLREVGSTWYDPASCTNSTCVSYGGYAYVDTRYCYGACVNETCFVGCMVDGVLREVGSTWNDPASCTNSTCVSYKGYAYVNTRYCYGACVNNTCYVGCMVDGVLREVGSRWTDPTSCATLTCVNWFEYIYVRYRYCNGECVNGTCFGRSTCYCSGDPHCLTFDDLYFDYQGICRYNLASVKSAAPASLPKFEIYSKNEHRYGYTSVSYVKYVEIQIDGGDTILMKGDYLSPRAIAVTTYVNTSLVHPPYSGPGSSYTIELSGSSVFFQTSFGLQVMFDGRFSVYVYIPQALYSGHVYGLCGNNDGNYTNDWTTSNGTDVGGLPSAATLLGDSFIVPDPSSTCDIGASPALFSSTPSECTTFDVQCSVLSNPTGVFSECLLWIEPAQATFIYDGCMLDACYSNGSSICSSIKAFVDYCNAQGVTLSSCSVLNSTQCDAIKTCPAGMSYQCEAPGCAATCSNPDPGPTCTLANQDACVCPDGMFLHQGECVSTCPQGCFDENMQFRSIGAQWRGIGCNTSTCQACTNCSSGAEVVKTTCRPDEICDRDQCVQGGSKLTPEQIAECRRIMKRSIKASLLRKCKSKKRGRSLKKLCIRLRKIQKKRRFCAKNGYGQRRRG